MFIKYLNLQTFQLWCICYNKKGWYANLTIKIETTTYRNLDFREFEQWEPRRHFPLLQDFQWSVSIDQYQAYGPIYKILRCCTERKVHHHHRTKMVIRVFEERCTTISKDITKLTTTPTSMFQIIERKNVRAISVRSTQDFILQQIIMISHMMMIDNRGNAKPKVVENFMWSIGQKRKDNAGDTKKLWNEWTMMNKFSNIHWPQNAFREGIQPW